MKKESLIIIFYIVYFGWLLVVTFLNLNVDLLNIFTSFVALFYLIFLRQDEDLFWFILSACVPVVFAITIIKGFSIKFEITQIQFLPLWLPIAWGTTIVALRKFFSIVTS